MKIIDNKVLGAIKILIFHCKGNKSEAARKLGFSGAHVGGIVKGKVNIVSRNWRQYI